MTSTIDNAFALAGDHTLLVSALARPSWRVDDDARVEYRWQRQHTTNGVDWTDTEQDPNWRRLVSILANVWDATITPGTDHSYRVFRYQTEHHGVMRGVALRERRGLKAMMASIPPRGENVDVLMRAYTQAYGRPDDRWMMVRHEIPARHEICHTTQYTLARPTACLWMGIAREAVGMNVNRQLRWRETIVLSPRPFKDTPICVPFSLKRFNADVMRILLGGYRDGSARCYNLTNKTGEVIKVWQEDHDTWEAEERTGRELQAWIIAECDAVRWTTGVLEMIHVRGAKDTFRTPQWGETMEIIPTAELRCRIPDLREDLCRALFRPDRLERMMEAYGEDWMERV